MAGKYVFVDSASLQVDLGSTASASVGAGMVADLWTLNYAASTVGNQLRYGSIPSIFKVLSDAQQADVLASGYTLDLASTIQAAYALCKTWYFPSGGYLCGALTGIDGMVMVGDGYGTVFKVKNGTNTDWLAITAKSNLEFSAFRVLGNSANQSSGNAFALYSGSTNVKFNNVGVDDHYDWAFAFLDCTQVRAFGCYATNGRAGANANAVRAGFLFGDGTPRFAYDIEVTNCWVTCSNAFVDGFMSEVGRDHRIIGCRTSVAYSGFKIKGDDVLV